MKKLTGILSILILALLLTACDESEVTRSFEFKNENTSIIATYKSKGDKVIEQNVEFIAIYADFGINSKEEAEEFFSTINQKHENAEGITEKHEYTDTEVITNLTIDFEKVDLDEVKDLPGMRSDGDTASGISMKDAAKQLAKEGFIEVK